jgi:signal transduction histidine kinase
MSDGGGPVRSGGEPALGRRLLSARAVSDGDATPRGGGQLAFRRRLFTALGVVGAALGVVSALRAVVVGGQVLYVIVNLTAVVAATVLVVLARRAERLDGLSGVVVGVVFAAGFGAMFLGGAGAYGTMPTYFILALVFVALMFDGVRARVLAGGLTAFYLALIVWAYVRLGGVAPPALDGVWLWDTILGFIGSAVGVSVAVMWQVSLYRRNEERLAERNRTLEALDQARAEFLGNVSHELKTPLAVIDAYAQASQRAVMGQGPPQELAEDLRVIAAQAARMALLVSSLVDAARIDEGAFGIQVGPVELGGLIQDTLAAHYPILTRGGNTLEIAPDAACPVVLADAGRIGQVLVNLLVNAAKHTEGGRIGVDTRIVGGFAEVTVSDTGEGIPPDVLPMVFERYKTAARRTSAARVDADHRADTGIGLGLFIAHHIVTRHGGTIEVSSIRGEGTTVAFTLPLAAESV